MNNQDFEYAHVKENLMIPQCTLYNDIVETYQGISAHIYIHYIVVYCVFKEIPSNLIL